jgi:hypothetical protein
MQVHVVSWVHTKVSGEPTASVESVKKNVLYTVYNLRVKLQAAGFSEKLVPI